MRNIRDRFILFGLISISTFMITYIIANSLEGLFTLEPIIKIEMYYFIFSLPFITIIFSHIDLSEKEIIDEYLYLVISSLLFGLFLADSRDFITELIKYLKSDEILLVLYILIYIYLIMMFRETIKLKTKKRDV
jgi:hypothetical protein